MTDIVRDPMTRATRRPAIPSVNNDSTLLPLSGDQSQLVRVRTVKLNDQITAEFTQDMQEDADWFTGGLKWQTVDPQFALFVTFVFDPSSIVPIVRLECNLPLSVPYMSPGATGLRQDMCILPALQAAVDYHLLVVDSDDNKYDPKMIVTPINGIVDASPVRA